MSENKYRDYLSNDQTFYRQYLKSEDEPVGSSSFVKVTMGAAATVGLAAGTAAAYRRGAFRGAAESLISKLGNFRQTRLGSTLDSVRNWTKDDRWDEIADYDSKLDKIYARGEMFTKLPEYISTGSAAREVRQFMMKENPIIQDKTFELNAYVQQLRSTLAKNKKLEQEELNLDRKKELSQFNRASEDVMYEAMKKVNVFNKEQQENWVQRTGYRHATVADTWDYLPPEIRHNLQNFEDTLKKRQADFSIMDKVIDHNIMIKERQSGQPEFADMRDFRDAIAKMGDTVAEDFTTPFVKINPIRMFYLNEFTKNDTPQLFASMVSSKVQPYIRNNLPIETADSIFVNGRVMTFDPKTNKFTQSNQAGILVNARNEGRGSLLARATKNMFNLYEDKQVFTPSDGWKWTGGKFGIRKNIWEPIAKKLDFGFQNEPIGQDPTLGDVAVYGSWIGKKLHDGVGPWQGIKPYQSKHTIDSPFGAGAEWLFIPRFKQLREFQAEGGGIREFSKQFYAARNNPDEVTQASFLAYTFAERLNATLNQMGFGLSAKHLGSAAQVMWQLSLRRALPVAGVIEGYKAINHGAEALFGEESEDAVATAFVESQKDVAKLLETIGVTDWAKEMTQILPGFEFIAELPIPFLTTEGMTPIQLKDLAPLDKTAEELDEYYESGHEAVRKGRYWETGTTPLVGGKVDYYQPNWYRRITSDWEYTENMWGSKGEYWMYHPKMPLLDPYHWEKKHYEDRPYQLTGGIPMIEEFPMIGPLLNATVGQLIKPQQIMHAEEWNNPGYYQEKMGFKLAESLEILDSMMGGQIVGASTGSAGIGTAIAAQTVQATYGQANTGYTHTGPYAINPGEQLAYVTSSGNISVMNVDKNANLYSVNQVLTDSGIGKTGVASDVRIEFPDLTGIENPEDLANPAGINMALGDFHYNTAELGGFYGWMSTMIVDPDAGQWDPRIETSSKAYGFNRQFWDQDYGNMGADAMEIFRRFVPRDMHKNYTNTIDNNMPTWLKILVSINSLDCWKPLKPTVPKCDNLYGCNNGQSAA